MNTVVIEFYEIVWKTLTKLFIKSNRIIEIYRIFLSASLDKTAQIDLSLELVRTDC